MVICHRNAAFVGFFSRAMCPVMRCGVSRGWPQRNRLNDIRVRILLIGSRNPWRMEAALQRALERAGHRTLLFDDRRSARRVGRRLTQARLRRVARRFAPDFVFLSKCLRVDLEVIHELIARVPNAMWYMDPPYHAQTHRPDVAHVLGVARLAQVFYVTGFVDEWRAHGTNARFLPAAAAAEITPMPVGQRHASEAAFIGSGYDAGRAEFLTRIASSLDTRVYGPGWEAWRHRLRWNGGPVDGREVARICSSAEFTLGSLPAIAAGATTYASNRMWTTMLAGGLYVGPWAPGIDRLAIDNEHCLWYRQAEDCIERLRGLLGAPAGVRRRIRRAGEALVRQHHTYDARVPNLIEGVPWTNPLEDRPALQPMYAGVVWQAPERVPLVTRPMVSAGTDWQFVVSGAGRLGSPVAPARKASSAPRDGFGPRSPA